VEAEGYAMFRTKACYAGKVGIVGAERQADSNLIDYVAPQILCQAVAVAHHLESRLLEIGHAMPVMVDEAQQPISAVWSCHNPVCELHGADICSKNKDVAQVPALQAKICRNQSQDEALRHEPKGAENPEGKQEMNRGHFD
jgi:hypothetical protein